MNPCSLFKDPACRFCSHEHSYIPYAPLVENKKTGRLEPGATEIRKELIGEFCNNICQWVRNLSYCPARWGLRSVPPSGNRAAGCGMYPDAYGQSLISAQDDIYLVAGAGDGVLEI